MKHDAEATTSAIEELLRWYFAGEAGGDAGLRCGMNPRETTVAMTDPGPPPADAMRSAAKGRLVKRALEISGERHRLFLLAMFAPRPRGALPGLAALQPYAAPVMITDAISAAAGADAGYDTRLAVVRDAIRAAKSKSPAERDPARRLLSKAESQARAAVAEALDVFAGAWRVAKHEQVRSGYVEIGGVR